MFLSGKYLNLYNSPKLGTSTVVSNLLFPQVWLITLNLAWEIFFSSSIYGIWTISNSNVFYFRLSKYFSTVIVPQMRIEDKDWIISFPHLDSLLNRRKTSFWMYSSAAFLLYCLVSLEYIYSYFMLERRVEGARSFSYVINSSNLFDVCKSWMFFFLLLI